MSKKEQATAFLQQSVPFSVMSVSHHQRHLHPECLTLPDRPHFFSMLLKSNVRPHLHRLPGHPPTGGGKPHLPQASGHLHRPAWRVGAGCHHCRRRDAGDRGHAAQRAHRGHPVPAAPERHETAEQEGQGKTESVTLYHPAGSFRRVVLCGLDFWAGLGYNSSNEIVTERGRTICPTS